MGGALQEARAYTESARVGNDRQFFREANRHRPGAQRDNDPGGIGLVRSCLNSKVRIIAGARHCARSNLRAEVARLLMLIWTMNARHKAKVTSPEESRAPSAYLAATSRWAARSAIRSYMTAMFSIVALACASCISSDRARASS